MIVIDGKRFFKPSEIAANGLILNSKGNKDYRYVLRLIENGKLEAKQWNDSKRLPYYAVSEQEIRRFNRRQIKNVSREETNEKTTTTQKQTVEQ